MSEYTKPLPRLREDRKRFWEGCKEHKLLIQKCQDCGAYRFPPSIMCPQCNSMKVDWAQTSGKGIIYTYTIIHSTGAEPPLRGFDKEYPYSMVIVELAEGIRIVSNMVDCKPEDLKIAMPVEVVFEDVTAEFSIPKFRPAQRQ